MGSVSKPSMNNSDTSSDEIEDQPKKSKDENSGETRVRFYECNFCKRGFTNAQALGGHMNIHRKDRAKATKQKISKSSIFPNKSREEVMNIQKNIVGGQVNYQFYVPTSSNPNFSSLGYDDQYCQQNHDHLADLGDPRAAARLRLSEDDRTANLSMQIDYSDHQQDIKSLKENELDLELRLG